MQKLIEEFDKECESIKNEFMNRRNPSNSLGNMSHNTALVQEFLKVASISLVQKANDIMAANPNTEGLKDKLEERIKLYISHISGSILVGNR